MNVLVGTSGFAFKEWKGPFYPEDLKDDAMLGYYSGKYPTVEINNTFYRLPKEHVLQDWASQVPESFSFSIKASQRITHYARLKPDSASALEFLLRNTSTLGSRLGPILFQLPPNMKQDLERLKRFLSWVPADVRPALEFRHESWHDEDVFAALRERNAALCISHADEDASALETPFVATADWAYLRLRKDAYGEGDLESWAERIRAQGWGDVFVFFKHEDEGTGPKLAKRFEAIAAR